MKIECAGLGQFMDVDTGTIENVLMLQNTATGTMIHVPVTEESFQAVMALRSEGEPASPGASSPPEPAPTNGTTGPTYMEPAPSMGSIAEGLHVSEDVEEAPGAEAAYVDLPDLGEEYAL